MAHAKSRNFYDNIWIVSEKFWDKIVSDFFRHKYLQYFSQVRPQLKQHSLNSFGTKV